MRGRAAGREGLGVSGHEGRGRQEGRAMRATLSAASRMDGESSERAASKDARKPARQLARNDAAHAPVPGPQHAAQHGARRSVDVGRLVSTLAKEVQLDTSGSPAFFSLAASCESGCERERVHQYVLNVCVCVWCVRACTLLGPAASTNARRLGHSHHGVPPAAGWSPA